ncbi:hypothetical protein F5B18DRAFT_637098 [Nemania serpens]|nr:hypothetical protein F5B18DRAFT_637098 [Nemania serpens]
MCEPLSKVAHHEEIDTGVSIYFNKLPPELRQLIWKEAVLTSMGNPEVLILLPRWISTGIHSLDKSSKFPPVNTGFPAVMHVNREARQIALLHVDMADLGPYPWNKCPVPQRPFRPEIDTLFVTHTADPFRDFCEEEVAKVQHLALDYCYRDSKTLNSDSTSLVQRMRALRTLRFVPMSVPAHGKFSHDVDLPFLPHRRYALRPITPERLQPPRGYTGGVKARPYRVPFWLTTPLTVDRTTTADPEASERVITPEACLITEFCYSPSGDSRFVAAGEKFPDSHDPSTFATYGATARRHDLMVIGRRWRLHFEGTNFYH